MLVIDCINVSNQLVADFINSARYRNICFVDYETEQNNEQENEKQNKKNKFIFPVNVHKMFMIEYELSWIRIPLYAEPFTFIYSALNQLTQEFNESHFDIVMPAKFSSNTDYHECLSNHYLSELFLVHDDTKFENLHLKNNHLSIEYTSDMSQFDNDDDDLSASTSSSSTSDSNDTEYTDESDNDSHSDTRESRDSFGQHKVTEDSVVDLFTNLNPSETKEQVSDPPKKLTRNQKRRLRKKQNNKKHHQ